jgi:hypothetical protein
MTTPTRLATDTAPSTPRCGIAGIKPSAGRVPRTGHILPFGGIQDTFQQLGYGPVTAGIVVHTRSREYETEPTGHQYTSLYLSVRPHQE